MSTPKKKAVKKTVGKKTTDPADLKTVYITHDDKIDKRQIHINVWSELMKKDSWVRYVDLYRDGVVYRQVNSQFVYLTKVDAIKELLSRLKNNIANDISQLREEKLNTNEIKKEYLQQLKKNKAEILYFIQILAKTKKQIKKLETEFKQLNKKVKK